MPKLIGLIGPIGAGKTTAAAYLEAMWFFKRLRFADPLKEMLQALGLGGRDLDGDLKETPHPRLCGRTPRHAMQTLGTEWGRRLIAPELWIEAMRFRLDEYFARPHATGAVVDDVRFPNEVALLRSLGGAIWRITGRGDASPGLHVSEHHWREVKPDAEIDNSGTPAALSAAITALMEKTA